MMLGAKQSFGEVRPQAELGNEVKRVSTQR
jgi:hypothetical protein